MLCGCREETSEFDQSGQEQEQYLSITIINKKNNQKNNKISNIYMISKLSSIPGDVKPSDF